MCSVRVMRCCSSTYGQLATWQLTPDPLAFSSHGIWSWCLKWRQTDESVWGTNADQSSVLIIVASPLRHQQEHSSGGSDARPRPRAVKGAIVVVCRAVDVTWRSRVKAHTLHLCTICIHFHRVLQHLLYRVTYP